MKKYNLPLTYPPKIPKVLSGECPQTIRPGSKFKIGDLVSFHGWSGKPYRSSWSFGSPPKYWELRVVKNCVLMEEGIDNLQFSGSVGFWYWDELDRLAELDGIEPPTGEELGKVLTSYHKIPEEGLPAQIIRWKYE
jgi:hypothetical protein